MDDIFFPDINHKYSLVCVEQLITCADQIVYCQLLPEENNKDNQLKRGKD